MCLGAVALPFLDPLSLRRVRVGGEGRLDELVWAFA